MITAKFSVSEITELEALEIYDGYIVDYVLKHSSDRILYVMKNADSGAYWFYDNGIWNEDQENEYRVFIEKEIRKLINKLQTITDSIEPKTEEDDKGKILLSKEYKFWLSKLEKVKNYVNYRPISNIWNMLKARVSRRKDSFDTNKNLLNFKNGTLELDTWTFREHRPDDMLTQIIEVNYAFELTLPDQDKWYYVPYFVAGKEDRVIKLNGTKYRDELSRCFPVDKEKRWIRCLSGGALARKQRKIYVYFTGLPDTGKTTLLNAWLAVLNDDEKTGYAIGLNSDTFTKAKSKQATRNDLLQIKNKVLAGIDEVKDEKQDSAAIKTWTGGSKTRTRGLYGADEGIDPETTFINTCNDMPPLESDNSGIASRLIIVPFKNVITETIEDYWKIMRDEEKQIILIDLLEGLKDFMKNGMPEIPERFKEATADYIGENNRVLKFIKSECVLADGENPYNRMTWIGFSKSLENYYVNIEKVDKKYIPGRDKILKILKQNKVTFKEVERINTEVLDENKQATYKTKPYRNVLKGIRLKTDVELYNEELKAASEEVDTLKKFMPTIITSLISESKSKCLKLKEICAKTCLNEDQAKPIIEYMKTNNMVEEDGPGEYALPFGNNKLKATS